jgi:hypothetical protein
MNPNLLHLKHAYIEWFTLFDTCTNIHKHTGLYMRGAATSTTSLDIRHDLFPMVVAF